MGDLQVAHIQDCPEANDKNPLNKGETCHKVYNNTSQWLKGLCLAGNETLTYQFWAELSWCLHTLSPARLLLLWHVDKYERTYDHCDLLLDFELTQLSPTNPLSKGPKV